MNDSTSRIARIKAALDDIGIGAAGDLARLQVHLLSLRARARTENVADEIENLEHRLEQNLEQAVQAATSKTRQLSSAVQELLGQELAEPGGPLNVGAIMTEKVYTCSLGDALDVPARLMWEHDFGAVPALSADDKLSGILTDRDICMAAYTKGEPLSAIRVRDVMARPVHTCSPEDSVERAATFMADAQIRRLPVVDREHRLVGVIAVSDIARMAPALGQREGTELVLHMLRAISQRPHRRVAEPRPAAG